MSDGGLATDLLSKRELEVATAYAAGASNKEIARDLGLSPTTVRSHLRTVYSKLGVTSKIELAQTLDDQAGPREDRDRSEMAADLALELDDAIRRERSLASVLRIISNHDGSLETTIDDVLKHALEICEAEFGILFEYHGDFRISELRSRGISPAFRNWLSEIGAFKIEPTTGVGRAAAELKPVSIDDVRAGGVYESGSALRTATVDHGNARSLAAIPMTSGNRLIGVFSIYRTRVHPFNERTLDLIQLFADQAVIAIDNARQFQEVQSRLDREAGTREVLEAIRNFRDDEAPVLEVILRQAAGLCDADAAALTLGRAGERRQSLAAAQDMHPKTRALYKDGKVSMNPETSLVARAIVTGKTLHVPDYAETDEYRAGEEVFRSLVDDTGMRTSVNVPLLSDGHGIGALVLYRRTVRPYEPDQIALVEMFAGQAVIAIENVRQFRELQTRLDREAATREILSVISRSRDDEKPVFDLILEHACRLCETPIGAVVLGHEGGPPQKMVANRGASEASQELYRTGRYTMDPEHSIAARAIIECRTIQVEDMVETDGYRQGDPRFRTVVDEAGIRTNLFVPLVSQGKGIGSFLLFRREVRPFTPDQIALVETFAAQAVIAIENVRQFKALESLNAELGERVEEQVGEIERMGKLKRFLPAAVADTVVTSGSEKLLKSHRALLGVLFCDIRGFTAFCETAEPEETIEVLQTYHEEMGKLINEHDAGVDHRMGDGIMVLFNDPLPCEDPAGEAVRLALAMRTRMDEMCQTWKRLGHRLGFGVGISLGYATVGMVGYEGRYDYTASGTAVNIAARLCDHAEDGEILLSPRAWTAVEDRITATSRGEVAFKGINREIEVMCIEGGAVFSD
ncbi:MAG: GAF domain-containing protein [Pseudomonadota bacterium]